MRYDHTVNKELKDSDFVVHARYCIDRWYGMRYRLQTWNWSAREEEEGKITKNYELHLAHGLSNSIIAIQTYCSDNCGYHWVEIDKVQRKIGVWLLWLLFWLILVHGSIEKNCKCLTLAHTYKGIAYIGCHLNWNDWIKIIYESMPKLWTEEAPSMYFFCFIWFYLILFMRWMDLL